MAEDDKGIQKYQLRGEILSFIPVEKNVEVMLVTITNTGRMAQTVTPTAAIPLYGRSADNIRDHRHVTSLLHRIETTDIGVLVTPTLSFDERGHQVNHMTYYCVGWSGNGEKPVDFIRQQRILSERAVTLRDHMPL